MLRNNFASPSDRASAAAALDVPPLPFAFADVWADFCVLDERRVPAMSGASPLMISDILGYGQAMHGGYARQDIETLLGLDSIRLRVANNRKRTHAEE